MKKEFSFQVAAVLLFDKNKKLLLYLRDNKPTIPFPNHWDFFGGIMEEGETPEQTLLREVKEELGIDLKEFHFYKIFDCLEGDVNTNRKFVYYAQVDFLPEELKLLEVGQQIISIDLADRNQYRFANILASIVDAFATSGIQI